MTISVSHSEVESFLTCERKHFYGYTLELERIEKSEAMRRGILGHTGLEHMYKAIQNGVGILQAYEIAKDAVYHADEEMKLKAEVLELLKFHTEVNPFAGYKIEAVEQEYTANVYTTDDIISVHGDVIYPVVIDLVISNIHGDVGIIDHKFVYDFYRPDQIALMPQIPKYWWVLNQNGIKPTFGMYNMLRYRKLKAPEPEQKNSTHEFTPTDTRIRRIHDEQMATVQRILKRREHPDYVQSARALRTANKMVCDSCSFKSLCVAELNDTNPQLVLRTEYRKRERRTFGDDE